MPMTSAEPAPSSPMSPPILSDLEKDDMRQLARDLHDEVLLQYENYVETERRQVDPRRWDLARVRGGLKVYRARPGSAAFAVPPIATSSSSGIALAGHSDSTSTTRSMLEIGPQAALAANSAVPMYMIAGTVQGDLDDLMYGLTVHDTRSLKRRSAQLKDRLHDNAVVATLESATEADPYRFLGVIWYFKEFPMLKALVKPRDSLVLLSVSMATTSRGERIGMMMNHSIDLSVLDSSSKKRKRPVRSLISVGKVFRQAADNVVEVFMTDYADPRGNMVHKIFTDEIATIMLQDAHGGDCGFKKKLEWLRRHGLPPRRRSSLSWQQSVPSHGGGKLNACYMCGKASWRSSKVKTCDLCHEVVCNDCLVCKPLLTTPPGSEEIVEELATVCVTCVMRAQRVPTFEVARQDFLIRTRFGPEMRVASTSTMSSTSFSKLV